MAELSTLARPYAKAAFEFARDASSLAEWSTMLATAAQASQQDKLAELLSSPALTSAQQAKTLADVCGDALNDKGLNFISALADNKRLALLPYIQQQFELLRSQQEQRVDVEVISAFELTEQEQTRLREALTRKLSREVDMQSRVDAGLLGGVIVRAGDTVIDGSVRGRLTKLVDAINH
ncbi:MAG: F0F1 ATP synthase subunit delta [Pseudomonadales bacterium]